jgi:RNA polymerase sigma-70 factor (ECF subfamily)
VFALVSVRVPTDLTDDQLAERAKTDSDAFGLLYDRYVKRIYGYVYYRVGRTTEAEDLTERVFFQALENVPRYEFRGAPFSAWLFRIAHNLVANWHRDAARHPTTTVDEVSHWEDRRADPPAEALGAEERRELRQAIARLPYDRQHLLHMKFVEERSNGEIAVEMRRTEGAVKALLHRTMVALRHDLGRHEVRPG